MSYFILFYTVFKILCVFHAHSISQLELGIFHMLHSQR